MIRAHQPGSEPIDIPETIPNPVVVPKPTPTPIEPAPKEPVRIPEKVPGHSTSCLQRGTERVVGAWSDVTGRKQLAEPLAAAQDCDIERKPAGVAQLAAD